MIQYFIFIFLLFSISCQTTDKKKGSPLTDGDISLDLNRNKEEIPPALWSPMQRQLHAEYYFLVAEYENLQGNFAKSQKFYQAAYNLDPNFFLALKMIEAAANLGRIDEAIQQCRKMVLLYPKASEIHALFGKLLASRGVYKRAAFHYEKALSLNPEKMEVYIGLIRLHQYHKNPASAITVATELCRRDPSYADGWALLAKLYLSQHQKKRALFPAKRAFDLKSQDPEKVLIYAIALELNGKSKKAVRLYEILFRLNPTNEELIRKMVNLYRQIGDLKDALALLEEAEKNLKDPGPGLIMQQAFILWELKQYEKATKILDSLARDYPDSDRILYLAALGKERVKKFDKAIELYHKISKISAYYIHAQYRAARLLETQKKYAEALRIVDTVIASQNERAPDFMAIGANILAAQDRVGDAVALLKKGVESYSDNIALLFLLGVYYEKNGEQDECIRIMREVIQRDPGHSSAHNYLGYLYAERGENLEEAKTLIKRALELKPNDGFYTDSLGWVYFKMGQYDKALKLLIEALKLVPNEGVILEHIGDVHKAKNDIKNALEYYEKSLKGHLEKRDFKRVEQKLKKVKEAYDQEK